MAAKTDRRSLADAYVAGDADATALIDGRCDDPERWSRAIEDAGALHEAAREALRAQNAGGPDTSARRESLGALDEQGTVAVVSGQQPGLFGGALLAFLKAAATVSLARRVAREHGVRCVPVFWVQDEDHDFAEVAEHVWLAADGELGSARVAGEQDSRVALAHRALGGDVEACVRQLAAGLEGTPHGEAVAETIARCYRPGARVDVAFAELMGELLGPEGLLVLRPRTPELAAALSPLHRRAVEEREAIEEALRERAGAIEGAGFAVQVPVREGTALGFFHPEGPEGPRYRIVGGSGGALSLAGDGRSLPLEQLREAAEREPLRFSTSALLRPIAQDTLLPTVAYVGGPSEVAYFAQLPPLYERFGLRAPVVVRRPSARWMDGAARELLGDRPADDETLGDDGPLARALASRAGPVDLEGLAERLEQAVSRELDGARPALAELDPGLAKACDKTRGSAQQAFDKLVRRATRVALSQAPAERAGLERLRNLLRPRGAPQERVLGWTSAAARFGPDRLREAVLGLDPLDAGPHTLLTDSSA